MNNNFYKSLEDKFRGSRDLIKERLTIYLPFLEVFKNIEQNVNVVDVGCGRGEWLQLLQENGIDAFGVDTDEGMLENAKKFGLNVKLIDAIEYLKSLDDESLYAISGFHIAEHLDFELLKELVKESFRVLKPAGLLILETPNPENIKIATCDFYLDPTHIKPIPPNLLSFLPEFYGFKRTKILRLQEDNELKNSDFVSIHKIIQGASPDYAVVAQKSAKTETLELFDEVFAKDYGLQIDTLMSKFEKRLENMQKNINILITSKNHLEEQLAHTNLRSKHLEEQLAHTNHRSNQVELQILSLLNSKSWKLTAPLRKFADFLRWFKKGAYSYITFAPQSRPVRVAKSLVSKIISKINENPKIKSKLLKILNNFPKLKAKLKEIKKTNPHMVKKQDLQYKNLSSKEEDIYNKLKNEIEKGKNR
ncbi:class I SAM-dependent methyltransferase [Aliarcobacter cryaerophilus]|nr:class I SAM-dependent methyltransferase [Aliarcobacter cryaerophilus]